MEQPSYVVVFPNAFSKNRIPLLVSNIRKILRSRGQEFSSIRRDGDVILVDANDPVFASSAINLLFGIEKIAIARRVDNDFDMVVSEIASVGGNLLLKGERFLVRVDGVSSGFLPKDVELAATSKIIESKSELGAKPGTEHRHDKVLYSHLTKKNAYVCIFLDDGMGGVPLGSDGNDVICCIYDELSAISCYEAIRQGYSPRILVCYKKKSEILALARALNQILPRLLDKSVTIEVFHAKAGGGRLQTAAVALEILVARAKIHGIRRIAVSATTLAHPIGFVDNCVARVSESGMIPVLPLGGSDRSIFDDAVELGMRGQPRITLAGTNPDLGAAAGQAEQALRTMQDVTISVGPNNVHDFMDAIGDH